MNANETPFTANATATAPAVKAPRKAPKAPAKAAKAPAGKKAAKARKPVAGNGRYINPDNLSANVRKDGALTKRQLDVLRILAKKGRAMEPDEIAKAMKLAEGSWKTVRWALGSVNGVKPDKASLLSRKMVEVEVGTKDGSGEGRKVHLFSVRPAGRQAVTKADKE